MKFRSERDSLAEALATAGRAVASRGASAVLSGLLLQCEGNQLTVTGTDLDLAIRVQFEVIGIADGSAVVPAKLAADIVRSLEPGALTIEATEDRVDIAAARSHFGIRAYPAAEFPNVAAASAPMSAIDASALAEGLRQVVRASSNDDARPLLTGVLFTTTDNVLRMVATDSYRLALRDLAVNTGKVSDEDILVPARSLTELQRLTNAAQEGATVGIAASKNEISFTTGNVTISTRLLEGTYPDYRQLIPDSYPNQLVLGKESLMGALRRVRLLVRDNTTPVRLSMRAGGVDITVQSADGDASETVDGDFTGDDFTIAFNPNYLIDGIDAILSDEVLIESTDASRPATVRSAEQADFRYLLMPVRVP